MWSFIQKSRSQNWHSETLKLGWRQFSDHFKTNFTRQLLFYFSFINNWISHHSTELIKNHAKNNTFIRLLSAKRIFLKFEYKLLSWVTLALIFWNACICCSAEREKILLESSHQLCLHFMSQKFSKVLTGCLCEKCNFHSSCFHLKSSKCLIGQNCIFKPGKSNCKLRWNLRR